MTQGTNKTGDRKAQILETLCKEMAAIMHTEPGLVPIHVPFLEMGADSIVIVEAIGVIENQFNIKLTIREIFEDLATVDLLAEYLDQELTPDCAWSREAAGEVVAESQPAAVSHPEPVQVTAQSATQAPVPQATLSPSFAVAQVPQASLGASFASANGLEQLMLEQNRILATVMTQQLALLSGVQLAAPAVPVASHATAAPAPVSQAAPASTAPAKAAPAPVTAPAAGTSPAKEEKPVKKVHMPWGSAADLRARGLNPQQRKHLEDLTERFNQRTRRSKELAGESRAYLADSRATVGFRFSTKEMLYPLAAERCDGSRMWDVDGNEYIDFTMGFGVHLFGHKPPFIQKALAEELESASELGARSKLVGRVAALICKLTGHDRVVFANTGTEAVMAAIRLARASRGRDKIGVFNHAYHGHSDNTLARTQLVDGVPQSVPMVSGVPQGVAGNVLLLDYCDDSALDEIRAHAEELGGIIVEPVQSRILTLNPEPFLHKLRALCTELDIPLIFDEMISGFRFHPNGCQGLYGIQADLCAYGKIVGGGMPVGVVGGKKRYMDGIDGGNWNYGDGSYPEGDRTAFGGTFCQHPMSMAAGLAVLEHLDEQGPALQANLNRRTAEMAETLNIWFEENEVPIRVEYYGSLFRLAFNNNLELIYYHMQLRGIYIWEWRSCFLATSHTDADIATFIEAIKGSVADLRAGGILPPPEGCQKVPFSTAQKQMWIQAEIEQTGSVAYNVGTVLRLGGALNPDALAEALQKVVNRHGALRMTCDADGSGQYFAKHLNMPLKQVDLSAEAEPETALEDWRRKEINTPFDLVKGPLLRAHLLRMSDTDHVLSLTCHHIQVDGWTMGLISSEIAKYYSAISEGRSLEEPEPMQFREYLDLRRTQHEENSLEQHRDWWLAQYADGVPSLNLPTDRSRPVLKTFRGGKVSCQMPADLVANVAGLARSNRCTPFMTLFCAFATLYHRIAGVDDLVVGVPVSGRPFKGSAKVVGYCTHLMPVRSRVKPQMTFAENLKQSRTLLLDAYEHQDYPFADLLERLAPQRDLNTSPLVNLVFNLEPMNEPMEMGNLDVTLMENLVGYVAYDMTLNITDLGHKMLLECEFNTDLFDHDTVTRWLDAYMALLNQAVKQVETPLCQLPLLNEAAYNQLIHEWNQTSKPQLSLTGLHDLFQQVADCQPHSEALICTEPDGQQLRLSYAELNDRANRLAHHLIACGVGADSLVGLCMPRCSQMIVSMLAILKAGGAYLPLDPRYPDQRLCFMMEDAGLSLLLADGEQTARFATNTAIGCINPSSLDTSSLPVHNPTSRHSLDNLAYVIYTSGSTGKPKGVCISHRNGINHLLWLKDRLRTDQLEGFAASTSVCFDVSVYEIFGSLSGGSLILAPDLLALAELPEREQISHISTVPSAIAELNRTDSIPKNTMTLSLAGEALPHRLAQQLFARTSIKELHNLFGPTEATIYCLASQVFKGQTGSVTIGRPLPNYRVYVLDRHLQPLPAGVSGELYVAGLGLARGYLKRPAVTAGCFVPDPFATEAGTRLYRTGDLVRYLKPVDGEPAELEFLGRIGQQVKVRGYRIELGEVETVIAALKGVQEVAVTVSDDHSRLLAYVVLEPGVSLDHQQLRSQLEQQLPPYMVPNSFLTLDRLPKLPNNKLDRAALANTDVQEACYQAPSTPVEKTLAAIWANLLDREVGASDHFFQVGGQSLIAVSMVAQVHSQLGVKLELGAVFANPILRDLALLVASLKPYPVDTIQAAPVAESYELSPGQRQFWIRNRFNEGGNCLPSSFLLEGVLDRKCLKQTLDLLMERHEILRTIFPEMDGEPRQKVLSSASYPFVFKEMDLQGLDEEETEYELSRLEQAEVRRPVDLDNGPLWRMMLVQLGPERHALLCSMHHIIYDGWSVQVMLGEFVQIYEALRAGKQPQLPELAFQYKDYATWLNDTLRKDSTMDMRAYWFTRLSKDLTPLALPLDNPQGRNLDPVGHTVEFALPATDLEALRRLAASRGATVFMVLLAALKTLLYRHSGSEDIIVGSPVAGRAMVGLENQIGPYLNVLPLRDQLRGNMTFLQLLDAVRETALGAFAHQIFPLSHIIEELGLPRGEKGRNPLFDVGLTLQNQEDLFTQSRIEGLVISDRPDPALLLTNTEAGTDLWFLARQSGQGLNVQLVYNTNLFSEATIKNLIGDFCHTLHTTANDPEIQLCEIDLEGAGPDHVEKPVTIELEF